MEVHAYLVIVEEIERWVLANETNYLVGFPFENLTILRARWEIYHGPCKQVHVAEGLYTPTSAALAISELQGKEFHPDLLRRQVPAAGEPRPDPNYPSDPLPAAASNGTSKGVGHGKFVCPFCDVPVRLGSHQSVTRSAQPSSPAEDNVNEPSLLTGRKLWELEKELRAEEFKDMFDQDAIRGRPWESLSLSWQRLRDKLATRINQQFIFGPLYPSPTPAESEVRR